MLDNIFFPHLRQGKVKMLGVLSARRHPEFPDVPTFAEQGFPLDLPVWGGLLAPLGTPQPIIEVLAKAMNELNVDAAFTARMLQIGFVTYVATQEQLAQRMTAETDLFRGWVQRTNFKLE